ncbi:helix-turn-helix domain-containing protein [uncultured Hyphomonas sp.]|jgi:AraC-like DNA-binding protein|uniref:AraC family transcriptional regulator n=1 Tax=uncultured Hyphomonas sp. TaxID=225298 RepID=UPI001A4FEE7B|nr:helix-turn-helix domain-containing protein [Hyphomonas sp.]|tara:strand:- start:92037 stop:93020 length:984 start_codon:yes stop_codon:yes gene_type:complete
MKIAHIRIENDAMLRHGLPFGPVAPLTLYWAAFALSVCAFIAEYFVGGIVPQLGVVLVLIGFVPCGMAWLLSRELFRQETERKAWPLVVVVTLYLTCLISYVVPEGHAGRLVGMVASMKGLIGSAMLLMTFVEAIDGLKASSAERRFRLCFAGGYAAIVVVSLLNDQRGLDVWQEEFRIVAATLALAGASAAVLYRRQHPLAQAKRPKSAAGHPALALRLERLIETDHVFLEPQIKVADVAERLREPEYKISQCIVSDLGFANFNQMINSYRIEEAKRRLARPDLEDQPILSIAMDCGFGSLGPFNRSFKAMTGLTPSAYRRQAAVQ